MVCSSSGRSSRNRICVLVIARPELHVRRLILQVIPRSRGSVHAIAARPELTPSPERQPLRPHLAQNAKEFRTAQSPEAASRGISLGSAPTCQTYCGVVVEWSRAFAQARRRAYGFGDKRFSAFDGLF